VLHSTEYRPIFVQEIRRWHQEFSKIIAMAAPKKAYLASAQQQWRKQKDYKS
jgi:hypothetical protein